MSTTTASIQSGLPPGPKGTLIGGSIRQFRAGLLDYLLNTARDYGPLASFRIGPRRVFLASGPEQDLKQFALIQMNMGREVSRRLREADNRLFRARMGIPEADIEHVFLGG